MYTINIFHVFLMACISGFSAFSLDSLKSAVRNADREKFPVIEIEKFNAMIGNAFEKNTAISDESIDGWIQYLESEFVILRDGARLRVLCSKDVKKVIYDLRALELQRLQNVVNQPVEAANVLAVPPLTVPPQNFIDPPFLSTLIQWTTQQGNAFFVMDPPTAPGIREIQRNESAQVPAGISDSNILSLNPVPTITKKKCHHPKKTSTNHIFVSERPNYPKSSNAAVPATPAEIFVPFDSSNPKPGIFDFRPVEIRGNQSTEPLNLRPNPKPAGDFLYEHSLNDLDPASIDFDPFLEGINEESPIFIDNSSEMPAINPEAILDCLAEQPNALPIMLDQEELALDNEALNLGLAQKFDGFNELESIQKIALLAFWKNEYLKTEIGYIKDARSCAARALFVYLGFFEIDDKRIFSFYKNISSLQDNPTKNSVRYVELFTTFFIKKPGHAITNEIMVTKKLPKDLKQYVTLIKDVFGYQLAKDFEQKIDFGIHKLQSVASAQPSKTKKR